MGAQILGRLLITEPASGPWNMAVDEVLLSGMTPDSIPILRFYEWQPATLSLGYFQSLADRAQHAASEPCCITRRLSGGGAILHDHELTYSVMIPPGHRWSKDVQQLYDLFHETLIKTLSAWQVEAALCTEPVKLPASEEPFLCFQRRATGDVLLDGHKICGSAQRRRQGAVLQHGSILSSKSEFAPELPGIIDLSPCELTSASLRLAWIELFRSEFKIRWEPDRLTPEEVEMAHQLATEKYDCSNWVGRR